MYIAEGGSTSIRILDDGCGMTPSDLDLCWLPHATSKIDSEEDLYRLRTLGFRGEALSSIASVSRLEITSATGSTGPHRILIHGGDVISSEPSHGNRGTVVDVTDLFYTLPGRKKFLKRASAEALLCRGTFLDKALPFPGIAFRFFSDGEMKLFLPAADSVQRVADAYHDQIDRSFLREAKGTDDGFSVHAVLATPDCFRKDRKFIQIFVNRRRIIEFSLVQAVEYGFSEYMPGGRFPYAFIFIEIDPELVDFNIHPAKREVRFRNLSSIHHRLSETIRTYLSGEYRKQLLNTPEQSRRTSDAVQDLSGFPELSRGTEVNDRPRFAAPAARGLPAADRVEKGFPFSALREPPAGGRPVPEAGPAQEIGFRYLGQILRLFLVVERAERLYLIDQHAAHERIIFDSLTTSNPFIQKLLVPFAFEVTDDEETMLRRNIGTLERIGIRMEKDSDGLWAITAVPETCRNLLGDIVSWLRGEGASLHDADRDFFSVMACRAAVKEGDPVDDLTAREIIRGAFRLEVPRCPHGRPVWIELSKNELYRLVERL